VLFNIPPVGRSGCRKGNKESDHRSKKHKNDTFPHFTQIGGGESAPDWRNQTDRDEKEKKAIDYVIVHDTVLNKKIHGLREWPPC
jgi:hypothetical protein